MNNNGIKGIDKKQLAEYMRLNRPRRNFLSRPPERKEDLIISLTSIPSRMEDVHYTLYSLLNQTVFSDRIILYLGNEQFPNKLDDVPVAVKTLCNEGLEIKFVPDIKSYKKLIFSLEQFPDASIVTADDDMYYPETWLEDLEKNHIKRPKDIIAFRCRTISFSPKPGVVRPYSEWGINIAEPHSILNIPTGAFGILYPPHALSKQTTKREIFSAVAPHGDDLWFWAMAVLNNSNIFCLKGNDLDFPLVNLDRHFGSCPDDRPLWLNNVSHGNDIAFSAILKKYPPIQQKLLRESKKYATGHILPFSNLKCTPKYILKMLLPYGFVRLVQLVKQAQNIPQAQSDITPLQHEEFCPFCQHTSVFLPCGMDNPSSHGSCPFCSSLERDRVAYYIYQVAFLSQIRPLKVLHLAPEKCTYGLLRKQHNLEYTCMDLCPENFPWAENIEKRDALHTTYPDHYYDVIIANHLIEHIPEKEFFTEMKRIMEPDAVLIISTPVYWDQAETLDNPEFAQTPEDRKHYFGQADHIRKYGADVVSRFQPYFASVQILTEKNMRPFGDVINSNFFILRNR